MVVLLKGTLVHYRGMPFTLLSDVETDGLESNYQLVAGELDSSFRRESNGVPDSVDRGDGRPVPGGDNATLGVDNA